MKDIAGKYYGDGIETPQIRVWCHNDHGSDYYVVFTRVSEARQFITQQINNPHFWVERDPCICYHGEEQKFRKRVNKK